MTRRDIFAIRLNSEERRLFAAVARRLERSQSDTVRLVMRNVAQELGVAGGECTAAEMKSGEAQHARR